MAEQVEVSDEMIEEEMKKMIDEMLPIHKPIVNKLIEDYQEIVAWLEELKLSEQQASSRGRPKRNAFKNATSKITYQANAPTKLRRPESNEGPIVNIYDHLNQKHDELNDKKIVHPLLDSTNLISDPVQDTSVIVVEDDANKLHEISDEENHMPPPKEPIRVPKKRGRKVKKEKISLAEVKTETEAEVPIRRSNRLNTTTSVAKETPVVIPQQENLNTTFNVSKLASASGEKSIKDAVLSVPTQNDTVESVYEDAVAINSNVPPEVPENEHVSVLKIDDNSQVQVVKAVESDKKILRATVSVIKMESLKKPIEKSGTPTQDQIEIEVISDSKVDETFVKGIDPNLTHVIKTEILSPEKQCNNQTVVIEPEKTPPLLNNTVTIQPKKMPPILNSTVTIESNNAINQTFDVHTSNVPSTEQKELPLTNNIETNNIEESSSLITDDDSEVEVNVEEHKQQISTKPIQENVLFSSQSPVKCRVQAFEKVIAQEAHKPLTRRTYKEQEKESTPTSDTAKNNLKVSNVPTSLRKFNNTSQILSKTKMYTPQTSTRTLKGFTPLTKSTSKNCLTSTNNTSNTNTRNIVSGITTFLKVNPPQKTMNKEEVLKKQQSKEEEVMRKKEQLLHDKQEELKRKRMEKERLVQQARELQAKEKQIQMEKNVKEKEKKQLLLQKQEEKKKEEKRLKQAKKEEEADQLRAKQQAEEAAERERKRLAHAQHKAKQLKLQEQQKKLENQANCENGNVPKTAMADGFQNLDSDYSTDDEDRPPKFERPKWSAYENRQHMLLSQSKTSHVLIDNIFPLELTAPDLREIFPGIDKEKLRRKSSAVWRTPPRYSILEKY